jgi:hypothetical protein
MSALATEKESESGVLDGEAALVTGPARQRPQPVQVRSPSTSSPGSITTHSAIVAAIPLVAWGHRQPSARTALTIRSSERQRSVAATISRTERNASPRRPAPHVPPARSDVKS